MPFPKRTAGSQANDSAPKALAHQPGTGIAEIAHPKPPHNAACQCPRCNPKPQHNEAGALAAMKAAIVVRRKRGNQRRVKLREEEISFGSPKRSEHEKFGREADRARNYATTAQANESCVSVCIAAIQKSGKRVTHTAIAAQWPLIHPKSTQPMESTIRRELTKFNKRQKDKSLRK